MTPAPRTGNRINFPPAWLWLMDEIVPQWVKAHYSPRESWKNKPFGQEDVRFFSKGIFELSELFTSDRPREIPSYFNHPKFRSSYLLYFLPLQAAKFITLFQMQPKALEAAMQHARDTGTLRIADIGAGPGTASLALLLWLLSYPLSQGQEFPNVELDWFDTHRSAMEDGKALLETLSSHFPKLRNRVQLRLHTCHWDQAPRILTSKTSLSILGHVLNEARSGKSDDQMIRSLADFVGKASGAGVLIVEPALRTSAQLLSRLRDDLIANELLEPKPTSIWGPCLHAGRCPLASGRDWCHFSMPADIPGRQFKAFSKILGSERQWVKFSYLWLASPDFPAAPADPSTRLVISDPLGHKAPGGKTAPVLLCEPEHPSRYMQSTKENLHRGDLVQLKNQVAGPVKKL